MATSAEMPVALLAELDHRARAPAPWTRSGSGRSRRCRRRSSSVTTCGSPLMWSGRWSVSVIVRPRFRNAISCSRRDSVSKLQSVVSKMSGSGQNVMIVPVSSVASPLASGADRLADRVGLPPDVAVPADLHVQPGRQRVDHRDADAVQAAGDRVGLAVELAARVQRGQHDLDGGPLLDRVLVDRDAAAVVATPRPRRRPAGSPRSGHSNRPAPRRRRCRRPRRRGDAGRVHRSSRCTCRGACEPPPALQGP